MSLLNVNAIEPSTGTDITLGASGDTITTPSGAVTSLDGAVTVNDSSNDVDFRVESNGNANMLTVNGGSNIVGIGADPDLGVGLHIKTADSGGSVDSAADELVIEGSAHNGITFLTGTTQTSTINFGDSGDNNIGIVEYNHNTNNMHMYTNAALAMTIDSTGAVTKPLQPAFYAEIAGGNQDNIAINTAVTVLLNSEVFDVNADFNTGTYTFTAPVTGKYHFSVKLACNNVDEGASYYDLKLSTSNKAIYLGSWAFNGLDADATYFALVGSCTCDMDASDTASVEIYQGGGTAQTDLNNGTYMTGHLVC